MPDLQVEAPYSPHRDGYTVQSRKRMSKSRRIWLGLLTGMVATVATFSLWSSRKSNQTISELKSIADRLEPRREWEFLSTQPPVGAAVCIPFDGPCSQYSYRWATRETYVQGDLKKYVQQVGLVPEELGDCERNQRINAGGLSCHAFGVVDGWDVRITINDFGPKDDNTTVQIVVNRY